MGGGGRESGAVVKMRMLGKDRRWMTAEEDEGCMRMFRCTCCSHDYSVLHIQGLHVNGSLLHINLHFITKTVLPLNTLIRSSFTSTHTQTQTYVQINISPAAAH